MGYRDTIAMNSLITLCMSMLCLHHAKMQVDMLLVMV